MQCYVRKTFSVCSKTRYEIYFVLCDMMKLTKQNMQIHENPFSSYYYLKVKTQINK